MPLLRRRILLCVLLYTPLVFSQSEIVGKWITVDDDGETQKSVVEISLENGELFGRVSEILDKSKGENPRCKKCKGSNKNQPILGMLILRNFIFENKVWQGGYILDPETGKEYKCKLELNEGAAQLKVRGYLGFSFIGRTQFWERQTSVEAK